MNFNYSIRWKVPSALNADEKEFVNKIYGRDDFNNMADKIAKMERIALVNLIFEAGKKTKDDDVHVVNLFSNHQKINKVFYFLELSNGKIVPIGCRETNIKDN